MSFKEAKISGNAGPCAKIITIPPSLVALTEAWTAKINQSKRK